MAEEARVEYFFGTQAGMEDSGKEYVTTTVLLYDGREVACGWHIEKEENTGADLYMPFNWDEGPNKSVSLEEWEEIKELVEIPDKYAIEVLRFVRDLEDWGNWGIPLL